MQQITNNEINEIRYSGCKKFLLYDRQSVNSARSDTLEALAVDRKDKIRNKKQFMELEWMKVMEILVGSDIIVRPPGMIKKTKKQGIWKLKIREPWDRERPIYVVFVIFYCHLF